MSDSPRIFVVENDDSIRAIVHTLLESEGYQVESFADGELALERLKRAPGPCMILLDLLMPVMNGWEFMEKFTELPVTIVPIPVYIFSVTKEVEGATAKMGAEGFVKKPVNLDLLLQLIRDRCGTGQKAA